jgi:AraC-like DNA-binding protein
VQTFRYRGARRVCLPGQLHILHPDETHDGAAATNTGFGYRILYLAPELIRDALGGRVLPFVADPVQDLNPASQGMAGLVADIDEPVSDLGRAEIAVTIADALSGQPGYDRAGIDVTAAGLAREFLAAHAREQTPASALEKITGTDRFTLARHFRRAFGTSPDRYRTRRRLDLARAAIESEIPLAQAAADAGFADQSHMTRQFRQAYALTPARWANAIRTGLEVSGGVPRSHPPASAGAAGTAASVDAEDDLAAEVAVQQGTSRISGWRHEHSSRAKRSRRPAAASTHRRARSLAGLPCEASSPGRLSVRSARHGSRRRLRTRATGAAEPRRQQQRPLVTQNRALVALPARAWPRADQPFRRALESQQAVRDRRT